MTELEFLEAPEPGWTPIWPFPRRGSTDSYVSGDPESPRIRVRYFRADGEAVLLGHAFFGPGAEGPPGFAHGGSQAALLDEAMGACAWFQGHRVVAARIIVNFRAPLPLGTTARFESRVEKVERRKVSTRAVLRNRAGRTLAEAEGLFVAIDPKSFGAPEGEPFGEWS